jgi:DNA topoisomerase-1
LFTLKSGKITEEIKTENTGAEKGKLFPTDIGMVVNDFLVKYFGDILDFSFTATVEKEFDDIAQGMLRWNEMIKSFYGPFHKDVEQTLEKSDKATGERELGIDPQSGKRVVVKIGRFGPMVMIGHADDEEKPRFASLRKEQSINSITLEEALKLFDLPRVLGEVGGKNVVANVGRFGPYVGHDGVFASLKKAEGDDPMSITLERALVLLEEKRKSNAERTIKTFPENPNVQVLKGRWGAFIKAGKKNVRIPKDIEPTDLTLEKCIELAGGAIVVDMKKGKSSGEKTTKKAASKKTTAKKATSKKTTKTTTKKATSKK